MEMTMTLRKLLDQITAGTLIPADMFVRNDLDDILDRRGETDFEEPWLACFERIRAAWESSAAASSAQKPMDEVRKESFLVVSKATHQHEMASYVSDDFELISKSIALGMNDPYADQLLAAYRRGEIPGVEQRHAADG
jgi:hypothetical protein